MAEACGVQVLVICLLCAAFTMYDKHLLHLLRVLTSSEILDHLAIVAVTRKTLNLGDMGADAMVITKKY